MIISIFEVSPYSYEETPRHLKKTSAQSLRQRRGKEDTGLGL